MVRLTANVFNRQTLYRTINMVIVDQSLGLADIFAASQVSEPEDTIGFLLWRVAHRYQREVDRVLATLDVSHLQFVILIQAGWLGRLGDTVTQPGLAHFSKIHPMQLSSVLKKLEAKKLIERPRCQVDSRAKRIIVTKAAMALLAVALPRVRALQDTFFGSDRIFSADLHTRLRKLILSWDSQY